MSIYDQFSTAELDILRARAERAAQTSSTKETDFVTALAVKVGGETYALPITSLVAVYDAVSITPLPGVPPFVAGIANVRGHIMPVLRLKVMLGVPGADLSNRKGLVIASGNNITFGLCVEQITEVVKIAPNELSPTPTNLTTNQSAYMQGMLADGTALIDVEAILRDPSLLVDHVVA